MPDEEETLEAIAARLAVLEAERDIRRLASNYCRGFDRREFDRFRGIWHDDAVWVPHPGDEITGQDAIVARAQTMWLSLSASFHWTANHVVDINGEVAYGEADVNVLVCIEGSWVQALAYTSIGTSDAVANGASRGGTQVTGTKRFSHSRFAIDLPTET
jgi:ketosteroid isomerase-like protein